MTTHSERFVLGKCSILESLISKGKKNLHDLLSKLKVDVQMHERSKTFKVVEGNRKDLSKQLGRVL